jgi:hypothetical protein
MALAAAAAVLNLPIREAPMTKGPGCGLIVIDVNGE